MNYRRLYKAIVRFPWNNYSVKLSVDLRSKSCGDITWTQTHATLQKASNTFLVLRCFSTVHKTQSKCHVLRLCIWILIFSISTLWNYLLTQDIAYVSCITSYHLVNNYPLFQHLPFGQVLEEMTNNMAYIYYMDIA